MKDEHKAAIIDTITTESGDITGVSANDVDQDILLEPS